MHSLAMKKLVVLLVLGGAAFFGYRSFSGDGAVSAYEKFAEAWTHDNPAEAKKYADAETARKAFEEQNLRGLRSGAMIEAFRGTRYEIESRTRPVENEVALEVRQTIQFDPPGRDLGHHGRHVHAHPPLGQGAQDIGRVEGRGLRGQVPRHGRDAAALAGQLLSW